MTRAPPSAERRGAALAGHTFRPDIEGLRAVAVLAVLGYHFFPSYVPGGYFGVDVFFVISGFLITSVIARGIAERRFSILNFYASRIRRLFPAMLVVLAACFAAAWVLLFSFELERFARHVTAAILYVENFLLASELGYFDHDARGKPLLHFWSLAVEEQFYIVWPLLIVLVARRRQKGITAIAAMIAVASLAYTLGPARGLPSTFFDPLARAWELAMGAVLAVAPVTASGARWRSVRHAISILALGCLAATLFWQVPQHWHPGPATLLPVTATAVLIACGSGAFGNRRMLALPPAILIGQISYPLYLWHWPLLAFPFFVTGDKPGASVRLGLLALSFVLALLTWRWVERPIRARGDIGRTALALLGVAAALLAAVWGTLAWRNVSPDTLQAGIEAELEGPMWAFVSNPLCAQRYRIPADHPFCILSRDEPATMLLVGNSFANHLYYGFATDKRTRDHAILSYGSCNHMDSTATPACRMQSQVARSSKARQVIIISELWPEFSATGQMIDPVSKRPPRAGAPDAAAFSAELKNWIGAMARPGVRIVIVGPKPELPYDAKLCFDRPFKSAPENCSMPIEQGLRDISATRTLLREVARSIEGAHYVEGHEVFCRGRECSYLDASGLPLLRDNGHLSRLGSRKVVSDILSQLSSQGVSLGRERDR